jgi:ABC-type bacteriocin/lantibiotic exporter with double-glycine peptidase domain
MSDTSASLRHYFFGLFRGHYPLLAAGLTLTVIQPFLLLPMAWLVRRIFDDVVPTGDLKTMLYWSGGLILLQVLHVIVKLTAKFQMIRLTRGSNIRMIQDIMEKMYSLPRSYYTDTDMGYLHTLLCHNLNMMNKFTEELLVQVLPAACVALIVSAGLMKLNITLFCFIAASTLILWTAGQMSIRDYRKSLSAFYKSFHNITRSLLFILQHIELTRLQTAEAEESARHLTTVAEFGQIIQTVSWKRSRHSGQQEVLLVVLVTLILCPGFLAVNSGTMTIGELMMFYAGVFLLKPCVSIISSCLPSIMEGYDALESLHRFQNTPGDISYTGTRMIICSGKFTFDNVTFQYRDDIPVLQHMSFTIHPCTITAVTGPNGMGKSTLVYLLMGIYRPRAGRLLADDIPYNEIDIFDLRKQIAVVMQDPMLFPGTIRENILYGMQDTPIEQVITAAQMSGAHEFVSTLPQHYDTFIGEKGIKISGGQRQKIALARALVRKARLLILDEPSNHLDAQAVAQLWTNLAQWKSKQTIVVITHDRTVLNIADQVIRLE